MKQHYLPNLDRLSILAATILLGYTLARFIKAPGPEFSTQLPGVYLTIRVNIQTIVTWLVAFLAAAGADWLLRDHPALGKQTTIEHWLLPGLTAWVIGLPLYQLPLGPIWWIGFLLGGTALMLVLVAEYIAVDPDDIRQPLAVIGLTTLSFALYLVLIISLRLVGLRLYLLLPPIVLAAWLIGLRTLHLRLHGKWAFFPAALIALIVAQMTAAFHYWPISAVSFGLAVLGPTYAMTSLVTRLTQGEPLKRVLVESITILIAIWSIAYWLR
jgi:hypothetical protein